jgi:excinuclease ABC subunit B
VDGRVILYGDVVTESMRMAIDETARRRRIQAAYNETHGITPETVKKGIPTLEYAAAEMDYLQLGLAAEAPAEYDTEEDVEQTIKRLEADMKAAAKELEFERAADIRNRIRALRMKDLELKQS